MPLEVIETENNIDYTFDVVDFGNRMDTLCDNLNDNDNINTSDFVLNVVKFGFTSFRRLI